jgi:hypothetical protein
MDIAYFAEIGPQFGILVRVAYCGKIPAEFGNQPKTPDVACNLRLSTAWGRQ